MRMSIGVRRWHFRAGWRLSPSPDAQQAGRGGDGPKEGERVRRVAAVLECGGPGAASLRLCLCVSLCLRLCVSVCPCGQAGGGEGGGKESWACAPAWDGWPLSSMTVRSGIGARVCVCGLTIDNDRATLGPRFSASGPRRRHAPTRLG